MSDVVAEKPETDAVTAAPPCMHEGCTCVATQGEFCSDYCREHAGHEEVTCGCGHLDCIGTAEAEQAV